MIANLLFIVTKYIPLCYLLLRAVVGFILTYSPYSLSRLMRRSSTPWPNESRPFREVEKISRKREFHFEKNDPMSYFGKRSKKSEQVFPLFKLPLHVVERVVAHMSLADMLTLRHCSKKTRSIVDSYWQHQRSFSTRVEELHRLFPYIDPEQRQFESLFHVRGEIGKVLRMLPKNSLVEADFSGLRRFQRELMEEIMIRNRLDACSLFAGVTTMSFDGCIVSCDDLESLSYCMQNLKSLTLSDRLIDHRIHGEDVDAKKIQNFRTYKTNGLIGHRGRTIAHMKTLWPTLVQLTFV